VPVLAFLPVLVLLVISTFYHALRCPQRPKLDVEKLIPERAGFWMPGPAFLEGGIVSVYVVSGSEALVNPCLDLRQRPRDAVLAKPDPFGDLARLLRPRDVLRRVRGKVVCFDLLSFKTKRGLRYCAAITQRFTYVSKVSEG